MKDTLRKLVHGLLVCLIALPTYGNVLCQEQDGHVEIEPALHNHCRHEGQAHEAIAQEHHANFTSEDPCNPCTDVQIGNDLLLPSPLKKTISYASIPLGGIGIGETFVSETNRDFNTHTHFTFFAPLRDIVLRT